MICFQARNLQQHFHFLLFTSRSVCCRGLPEQQLYTNWTTATDEYESKLISCLHLTLRVWSVLCMYFLYFIGKFCGERSHTQQVFFFSKTLGIQNKRSPWTQRQPDSHLEKWQGKVPRNYQELTSQLLPFVEQRVGCRLVVQRTTNSLRIKLVKFVIKLGLLTLVFY